MERRNDERDRLRQACTDELRDLREADDDETSEVIAEVAARTATRTRQLSRPESEGPPKAVKGVIAILGTLPSAARLPALLAVIAAALAATLLGGHELRWW